MSWIAPSLLALAAWMYAVGMGQLQPLSFEAATHWSSNLVTAGACQSLSVLVLYFGLSKSLNSSPKGQGGALAAWLATAFWVGAAYEGQGWWLTLSPEAARLDLAAAVALACLWNELAVVTFLICAGTAWVGHPGLALTLAMAGLGQFGLTLWVAPALFLLALIKSGLGPLDHLLGFWWAWLLPWAIPAFLWGRFPKGDGAPGVVRTLLLWELASWTTGWYSLGAAGAIFGIWAGRGLSQRWPAPGSRWKRADGPSWAPWAVVLGLFLTWTALCPGEEWFNRRLLIGTQKAHIPLDQICRPHPLAWWVDHRGEAFALEATDLELADWIRRQPPGQMGLILTPGQPAEPRQAMQVISALADARPMLGWGGPGQPLLAAATSIRQGNPPDGCGADFLVLRGPHTAPSGKEPVFKTSGPSAVYALARASVPTGTVKCVSWKPPAPGALWPLQLSDDQPHRATWVNETAGQSEGSSEGRALSIVLKGPVVSVPAPLQSGRYLLMWDGTPPLKLGPYQLDREACLKSMSVKLSLPPSVPSRSLTPVELELSQSGPCPFDLAAERGLQLQCAPPRGESSSLVAPIQPLHGLLESGKSAHFTVYLSTPELEGDCPLEARLVGADGSPRVLDRLNVHTWRRWPPIAF